MKILIILLLFGWFSNQSNNPVIYIQPCNNFKNTKQVVKELEKVIDAEFIILPDKKLDNSEKLMTIELAMAKLNYDLYNVSGDKQLGYRNDIFRLQCYYSC